MPLNVVALAGCLLSSFCWSGKCDLEWGFLDLSLLKVKSKLAVYVMLGRMCRQTVSQRARGVPGCWGSVWWRHHGRRWDICEYLQNYCDVKRILTRGSAIAKRPAEVSELSVSYLYTERNTTTKFLLVQHGFTICAIVPPSGEWSRKKNNSATLFART